MVFIRVNDMYLCLEGIDGSGKSTQLAMLGEWLEKCGLEVLRVYEPTESPPGQLIREMLTDPRATTPHFQRILGLLFAADRMIDMGPGPGERGGRIELGHAASLFRELP